MADAFRERGDGFQVLARGLRILAAQEFGGIVRVAADGGDRLVDFVRDAGGHLSQQGQLAGLDQLILQRVQPRLGALAFVHFAEQPVVGQPQLRRAFVHLVGELLADGGLLPGVLMARCRR